MKILVTGASGFLGSHLVDRLLERGDEVHTLVRKSSNLRWLIDKPVHHHYGDVAPNGAEDSSGLEKAVKGIDVIYHAAGVIRARNRKTYDRVNAGGTSHLLETCLRVNRNIRRIVVVTSLAAHGPTPGTRPATEEDECHPLTDYGKSKREAERIAHRYVDHLPITIVRPPAIYGPRDEQVLLLFRLIQRGWALLPGRGRRILSLAHVQDVVTGCLLAAESPKAVGETFFVGEDHNYDWEEAILIIAKALQKSPIKIEVPAPLVYLAAAITEGIGRAVGRMTTLNLAYAKNFLQPNWGIDISKAQRILEFQSAYPLTRGVEETIAWYRNEGWM